MVEIQGHGSLPCLVIFQEKHPNVQKLIEGYNPLWEAATTMASKTAKISIKGFPESKIEVPQ